MQEDTEPLFDKLCLRMTDAKAWRQEQARVARQESMFDDRDSRMGDPACYESYRLKWKRPYGVAYQASRSIIQAVRHRSGSDTGRDAGGWVPITQLAKYMHGDIQRDFKGAIPELTAWMVSLPDNSRDKGGGVPSGPTSAPLHLRKRAMPKH